MEVLHDSALPIRKDSDWTRPAHSRRSAEEAKNQISRERTQTSTNENQEFAADTRR